MPLRIPNVPNDADELDILYFDPLTKATKSADPRDVGTSTVEIGRDLSFQLLKTVVVANLQIVDGKHVVPLAKGEDAPGRFFDVVAAKTINDIRYASLRGGVDYHNRPPYSSGKIRESFTVGQKGARIPIGAHLFDPDGRGSKLEIIAAGTVFGKENLPAFAALQGTDVVVDTSVARAETTVAVRLTDEKGAVAVLDVTFDVLTPLAPAAPGAVEYVALA